VVIITSLNHGNRSREKKLTTWDERTSHYEICDPKGNRGDSGERGSKERLSRKTPNNEVFPILKDERGGIKKEKNLVKNYGTGYPGESVELSKKPVSLCQRAGRGTS